MVNNPTTYSGTLHHSRKEANFLSYVLRNNPIGRMTHLKHTIASNHKDLLIPLIKITHIDRYSREIDYTINDGINQKLSGTLYQSRSQSDYMNKQPIAEQHKVFKQSIADSHSHFLLPHIQIISASKDYRSVEYSIDYP